MGHFYDEIPDDPKLIEWIKEQQLFHVATAPLKGGHVNVSPKGQTSFKLVNRRACWYLDLTGSGNETISHLYEPGNGRLVIMFEAFQGPPRILRFWGRGRVIERGTPEFDRLMAGEADEHAERDSTSGFPTPALLPGARAIIWLDITRVGTSCGYSVPFMKFERHRNTLNDTFSKREKNEEGTEDPFALAPSQGLHSYWLHKNTWSIDGLPGYRTVADRVNKGIIHAAMRDCGLDPARVELRTSIGERLIMLLVGLVLGLLLSATIGGSVAPFTRKFGVSL